MKCLVTGGAGFIGSHLVDELINQNHEVAIIDNLSTGIKENINPKAKFYKVDILDNKPVAEVFSKEKENPDFVFHLAAQINVRRSVEDPAFDASTNIVGSLNVLENCRKYNVKKIIFASSGGTIYGKAPVIPTPEESPEIPLCPYGVAKLSVEKYINYYHKIYGLNFAILRLANVYGPRQNVKGEAGVVAIFSEKMLAKQNVIINGDGLQTRDFVFVGDVVEAIILAMKSGQTGIFNVGTGLETNVNTIFKKTRELVNSDCEELHGAAIPGEIERSCLGFSKINKSFGWQPHFDLERGLLETTSWFKKEKGL